MSALDVFIAIKVAVLAFLLAYGPDVRKPKKLTNGQEPEGDDHDDIVHRDH